MRSSAEAEEIVRQAFKIGMIQSGIEARDFALWCDRHAIADVIELGTCAGGMMKLMDLACYPGLRISLDRPWADRDPKLPDGYEVHLYNGVYGLQEIFGDIHSAGVKQKLTELLAGAQVDLLFADADHSYAGAKNHFDMYREFIKPGGYFAMHDVANHHPCQDWWDQEIVGRYPTWSFEEPSNLFGIGVAQLW